MDGVSYKLDDDAYVKVSDVIIFAAILFVETFLTKFIVV